MPRGVYAAASAMVTESKALDVVAQNIANANSPGYRRQVALREGFDQVLAARGRTGDLEHDGGLGVRDSAAGRVFTQGSLQETQSDLDLAITGQGFFRMRDPQGHVWLTRNGHFNLASDGRLVDDHGWALEGQGGPIVVPPESTRIAVDDRGRVYAQRVDDQGAPVQDFLDQLRIVDVADKNQLRARDGQRFSAPEGAQIDVGSGASVRQGFIEQANVDPVGELVTMISVQRRYDAAQRALRTNEDTGRGFSDLLRGA
jgi:flagellar basal-body rod protein FlgG